MSPNRGELREVDQQSFYPLPERSSADVSGHNDCMACCVRRTRRKGVELGPISFIGSSQRLIPKLGPYLNLVEVRKVGDGGIERAVER